VLWEQTDLDRRPLIYPSGAPALSPGLRYTWELETREHGVQRASFELAPPADAARVKDALTAHVDVVARAGSQELSVTRLGDLLGKSTINVPVNKDVATLVARDGRIDVNATPSSGSNQAETSRSDSNRPSSYWSREAR